MEAVTPNETKENPYTSDPTKPADVSGWRMHSFGEYQNTNIQQINVNYAMAMVDKWFDIVEQPTLEESVAIVGYGPSLIPALPELDKFKTIVTCSGSHKMVLDAGFIPTYHVEIDWKPHKYHFTKVTHPDCTYLMSAACCPETIDNIKERKAELMFIEHGTQVTYPSNAPMIFHGYDVGQQAIECMRIKGFRKFALFGFDYCFSLKGERHAGEHGGIKHHQFLARIGDKIFKTSKTMFTALLVMEFYIRTHPELEFEIYSDSLLFYFLDSASKEPVYERPAA